MESSRSSKEELTKKLKDLLNQPISSEDFLYVNHQLSRIRQMVNLVRVGADPNAKADNGDSLLHLLLRSRCDFRIIQNLISHKANVDIRDANNRTPIECLLKGDYGIFMSDNEFHCIADFYNAYQNLAMNFQTDKKYLEAIDCYTKSIDLCLYLNKKSNESYSYYFRAFVYLEMKEYGLAQNDFETALRLFPGNFEAHYQLGSLCYNEGNYEKAIEYFNNYLRNHPSCSGHQRRGLCHYKNGNKEKALADLNIAISIDNTRYKALLNRAYVFKDLGKLAESIRDYCTAYSLKPDLHTQGLEVFFNELKEGDDLIKIEKKDLLDAILLLPDEKQVPHLRKCLVEPVPPEQRRYHIKGERNPLGERMWVKRLWKECRLDDEKSTLYKICKQLEKIDPEFEWPIEISKKPELLDSFFTQAGREEKKIENNVVAGFHFNL